MADRVLETSQSVSSSASATLYSYRVPASSYIILRKLGNYLDTAGAWGSVTWKLLRNGVPVYPYENIKDQRGVGNTPADTEPVFFSGGDELSVYVTNAYGSAVICGVSIAFDIFLGS